MKDKTKQKHGCFTEEIVNVRSFNFSHFSNFKTVQCITRALSVGGLLVIDSL